LFAIFGADCGDKKLWAKPRASGAAWTEAPFRAYCLASSKRWTRDA
jgi:hypothetical protein